MAPKSKLHELLVRRETPPQPFGIAYNPGNAEEGKQALSRKKKCLRLLPEDDRDFENLAKKLGITETELTDRTMELMFKHYGGRPRFL